jgi:hypothetical protein
MTPHARCVEVALARCRITRLQVSGVDTATAAIRRVGLQLLIMDKRDEGGEIAARQRKCGHAPVRPTRSNERTESIPPHVLRYENRPRQVGATSAASGVAAMAEATLRYELRPPGLDLIAWKRLRRPGLRRSLRSGTGLATARRCLDGWGGSWARAALCDQRVGAYREEREAEHRDEPVSQQRKLLHIGRLYISHPRAAVQGKKRKAVLSARCGPDVYKG